MTTMFMWLFEFVCDLFAKHIQKSRLLSMALLMYLWTVKRLYIIVFSIDKTENKEKKCSAHSNFLMHLEN